MQKKRQKQRKITAGVVILAVIVFIVLVYAVASLANITTGKLLVVPIRGTITTSDTSFLFFEEQGNVPFILDCLEQAESDSSIKAVLLDIDSPGGSATGSAAVAKKVKKLRQQKPVVSYIGEVGASGAYWIASASNSIVADQFSITGSIGVLASYVSYGGLLSKLNMTYERIVGGKYKDMGTPFRELEQDERAILLKKISLIHEEFIKDIAKNRGMSIEETKQVSEGLFYLGLEAEPLGLVDKLGDKKDARKVAEQLAGKKLKKVTCKQRTGFFSGLAGLSANAFYYLGKGIGSELFSQEPVIIS